MTSTSRALIAGLALCLATTTLTGCATRSVRHAIVKRSLIEVDLVRQVKGFTTEELGYEHPAIVSQERLANILNAIEVESKEGKGGVIRQPAFHPEIVQRTAEGLSQAFREAGPDQAIGVKVIRKQMRIGVFHRKFLTSFLAHMKDGHLYLSIRRVDWRIPQSKQDDPLPEPQRNVKSMDFRVVSGDPIYFAGIQDLEIDWNNDVFRTAFRLPGSTSGQKRRREVILKSPVPKAELEEANRGGVSLDQLTPEQLRALADLEEERREGRMTETAYQRARRQLLRER